MKSFADIVKKGSQDAVTKQTIQRAVKTAVIDSERNKNVVVYGLKETTGESIGECFQRMVGHICDNYKPAVKECRRIGTVKPEACRPVKISFDTEEAAATILSRSRGLGLTSEFKSVYT